MLKMITVPPNAAQDLRWMLERGYPREQSLQLVGNRYALDRQQRHLMKRAVFSPLQAKRRSAKLISFSELAGKNLVLDAYNIIITIESGLQDRQLVVADDGVVRDIAGVSAGFRPSENTQAAIQLVADALKQARIKSVKAFFKSSMSKSGDLCSFFDTMLAQQGISSAGRTERSIETAIPGEKGVVITAHSGIMDRAELLFDLAGYIIRGYLKKEVHGL